MLRVSATSPLRGSPRRPTGRTANPTPDALPSAPHGLCDPAATARRRAAARATAGRRTLGGIVDVSAVRDTAGGRSLAGAAASRPGGDRASEWRRGSGALFPLVYPLRPRARAIAGDSGA